MQQHQLSATLMFGREQRCNDRQSNMLVQRTALLQCSWSASCLFPAVQGISFCCLQLRCMCSPAVCGTHFLKVLSIAKASIRASAKWCLQTQQGSMGCKLTAACSVDMWKPQHTVAKLHA